MYRISQSDISEHGLQLLPTASVSSQDPTGMSLQIITAQKFCQDRIYLKVKATSEIELVIRIRIGNEYAKLQ